MADKDNVQTDMVESTSGGPEVAAPQETTSVTLMESVKQSPRIIISAVLMTFGPMAFGFDIIAVGIVTAVPSFLITYGEPAGHLYILPSLWLSLWNATMQIGFMAGSAINGPVADRIGRRFSMAIGSCIAIAGVAVIYTSDRSSDVTHRRSAFLAGKTVLGLSLGMINSTSATYVSEIAPPKLRAPLLSMFSFFVLVGQLVAAGVTSSLLPKGMEQSSYRTLFATQWVCAGLAFVGCLLIPESPAYLLRRGNVEAARKSYQRLQKLETVERSIVAMQAIIEHEKQVESASQGATYLECFKGTNWRRTRITMFVSVIQQFIGITMVANSSYFLVIAGMAHTNIVMVLEIVLGLSLLANIISWSLAGTIGRRRTLLFVSAWIGVLWLAVGIAACFNSKASLWFIGVVLNLVLFFYSIGPGGVAPIIVSETSSIRLRAKTNSISFIFNGLFAWAFNFFVPYMFNRGNGNMGGKIGFFFAGLSLLAVVWVYFEVPEMMNRTFGELDEMFELRVRTRDFANHQCQGTVVHEEEVKM